MSKISIKKTGITQVGTQCIVNAANEGLWAGGGVCGIIFKAAGVEELTRACQKMGHCATGSAVITPAFKLNADYIIHAVGPVWQDGKHKEAQLLYGCYMKSLELAKVYNCHSIGFPLISTGIFGYPVKKAWRKALQACNDFINQNPDYDIEIVFAVIDDKVLEIGLDTLHELDIESEEDEVKLLLSFHPEDVALLKSINRNKLKAGIEYFCQYRDVEWKGGQVIGKTEEGKNIITWPYAAYPREAWDYIQMMEPDKYYGDHYEKYCKDVLPTDMNARQIRTMLTMVQRGERFCDGYFSKFIKDGSILKYLLRLDDLLVKLDKEYSSNK